MGEREQIALIDQLRGLPAETEWLDPKRKEHERQVCGECLSALADAACLSDQVRGHLVFGIDGAPHAVVGTPFDPSAIKEPVRIYGTPYIIRVGTHKTNLGAHPNEQEQALPCAGPIH